MHQLQGGELRSPGDDNDGKGKCLDHRQPCLAGQQPKKRGKGNDHQNERRAVGNALQIGGFRGGGGHGKPLDYLYRGNAIQKGIQLAQNPDLSEYLIAPDPQAARLTRAVHGTDHNGEQTMIRVVEERPLTIYLNRQEIVTAMTIGDYPEYLALGFLRNQQMLRPDDEITRVDYDEELETIVVRTARETDYEDKMRRKTRTSGCAVGTVFGDMMEGLDQIILPQTPVRTSALYALSAKINRTPSLYLEAGAIHGTVLCQGDRPLVYMEDVGRHNAVDKIAGWMLSEGATAADKMLYTTGRLTSEMVIKTAMMGIPVLASRSGFTAWGVEIAQQIGLTLIGRLKGRRFMCLSGEDRLIRDANPEDIADESYRSGRKGAA